MDRLESYGYLRDAEAETGRVTAIISTGDIARDGAIIDPAGWDFSNYDRNPVVLWMHDAGAVPFARTIERFAGEKELVAKAQFDLEDPRGAEMFRKVTNGYVNATSVRWLPRQTEIRKIGEGKEKRDVLVFTEQELLEWSFVTIPSDPKALIMREDGGALDLRQWLTPDPDPEPRPVVNHARAIAVLEDEAVRHIEMFIERRLARPNVDDIITRALARVTGKTEERIRREMAGGGN